MGRYRDGCILVGAHGSRLSHAAGAGAGVTSAPNGCRVPGGARKVAQWAEVAHLRPIQTEDTQSRVLAETREVGDRTEANIELLELRERGESGRRGGGRLADVAVDRHFARRPCPAAELDRPRSSRVRLSPWAHRRRPAQLRWARARSTGTVMSGARAASRALPGRPRRRSGTGCRHRDQRAT